MTKTSTGDWKTPLGYYEKAIAELKRTREEFQTELQNFRELQVSQATLKAELQATKAELQDTKAELQATNERLENLVTEAKKTASSACSEAKVAQDTANTTRSEIRFLKDGIKNGAIVAQKALMLRGRDEKHWIRFKYIKQVKGNKYDTFLIGKNDDNTWHHVVRVEAADKVID